MFSFRNKSWFELNVRKAEMTEVGFFKTVRICSDFLQPLTSSRSAAEGSAFHDVPLKPQADGRFLR